MTYLKTVKNVLYDIESHELVGVWNEKTKEIEVCERTLIGIQEGFLFTDFNGNIRETNGQFEHEGIRYPRFKDVFSAREHAFCVASVR